MLISEVRAAVPLADVLRVLDLPPVQRGMMHCPIPAHDDSTPSCSVRVLNDGVERWYCHACEQHGTSIDVAAVRLNLNPHDAAAWIADRFRLEAAPDIRSVRPLAYVPPSPPSGSGEATVTPLPAGREVEAYPYVDEYGSVLFEVVRFEPKAFRQRSLNAAGSPTWGLGSVRRVPYRLPRVLSALRAREHIWLVEGEKDVHALEAIGEVATTLPGGNGKWRPEYGKTFAGGRVWLIADRDFPGRAGARKVAIALREAGAASVRVYEPTTGKDISDHLAAGRSLGSVRFRYCTV